MSRIALVRSAVARLFACEMFGTHSVAQLAAAFVAQAERRDPLFADSIGIHRYEDRPNDYSAAGHARRMRRLCGRRHTLETALRAPLAPSESADAHALLDTL